ncbi:hypothetical protein KFE25_009582 [Diacronema lutheri]|uniref:Uncharacterized protein n=1 Tax=Diacronema lutheri TaxID=2081491 RepID=A0A8J5XKS2_DIALT|nr:hypothetical protein KFE25_009582 [Diacronema lutheri]
MHTITRRRLTRSLTTSGPIDPGECGMSLQQYIMLTVVVTCVVVGTLALRDTRHPERPASTNSRARQSGLSRYGAMSCGGAPMCGILALETGLGEEYYKHDEPTVHGLWPAVQPWGFSPCVRPASLTPRRPKLPECFAFPSPSPDHVRWAVEHTWLKHGVCAGSASEDDFFAQVCELAAAPLQLMAEARRLRLSMKATAAMLRAAGLPVYNTDTYNGEVLLSACAVRDLDGDGFLWRLANISAFPKACRSKAHAAEARDSCLPSIRGPACAADDDCTSRVGCARCTASGYCTSRSN